LIPFNLKNLQPYPYDVFLSIGIFLTLSWVLKEQSTRGVLWFVPAFMRKKEFNYLIPKRTLLIQNEFEDQNLDKSEKKGILRRFLQKIKFLFVRSKIEKVYSRSNLKSITLDPNPDYGKLETDSSISGLSTDQKLTEQSQETETPDDSLNVSENAEFHSVTCSICLCNILEDEEAQDNMIDDSEYTNQVFKRYSEKYRKDYIMNTPCNHFFHIGKSISYKN
jgi:hypothetical protein